MKIVRHGVVILSKDGIRVEGWLVKPESTDPPITEATYEQMLLEVTIPWAQQKLNSAIMENLQRVSKLRKAAAASLEAAKGSN